MKNSSLTPRQRKWLAIAETQAALKKAERDAKRERTRKRFSPLFGAFARIAFLF